MAKAIVVVMDGVGCGNLADANLYGDEHTNTLAHIAESQHGLTLPVLESLGLGKTTDILGVSSTIEPIGAFGKMIEKSPGKDSVTGHWEIAGVHLESPFPTYPDGFPEEIITPFTEKTQRGILGNIPASGTAIISELGEEHLKTGKLIVYTSADSVFQIAAHEDIVSVKELYHYCEIARELLRGKHEVGRVIARPFIGNAIEGFTRTKYRKDYSVVPTDRTIFDLLSENDMPTIGVGKIDDLFGSKGIQEKILSKGNRECMETTIDLVKNRNSGIIMTNLVDFDMVYGHQRDPKGFKEELIRFDKELQTLLDVLHEDDLLFLTADHGNDPTHIGNDHTREFVPVLVYGKQLKTNVDLGTRESFADIGITIADMFKLDGRGIKGNSFYSELI